MPKINYEHLVWGNPHRAQNPRSAESYYPILEPLVKLGLVPIKIAEKRIELAVRTLERQDVVEAWLIYQRAELLADTLRSWHADKYHVNEISKMLKILNKSYMKIFGSLPDLRKPELQALGFKEHPTQYERTPQMRGYYEEMYIDLELFYPDFEHLWDMMQNNLRYRKFFLKEAPSFANRPLRESLDLARELEGKLPLDLSEYDKLLKQASPTELYMDLGDGFAWFHIKASHCKFEATLLAHCGAEYGATLFSLREKNKQGMWIPRVTAAHRTGRSALQKLETGELLEFFSVGGYLTQIKGSSNHPPNKKYHPYIVELLLSPAVESIKKSTYKPELDFHFTDLDEATQKQILKVKPYMNDFQAYQGHTPDVDFAKLDQLIKKHGALNLAYPYIKELFGYDVRFPMARHMEPDNGETVVRMLFTNSDLLDFVENFDGINPYIIAPGGQKDFPLKAASVRFLTRTGEPGIVAKVVQTTDVADYRPFYQLSFDEIGARTFLRMLAEYPQITVSDFFEKVVPEEVKANPQLSLKNKKLVADDREFKTFSKTEDHGLGENLLRYKLPDFFSYKPNMVMLWLLDSPEEVKKVAEGKRGIAFFDPPRAAIAFSSGRAPIESIFKKGKDSKNIIGAVLGSVVGDNLEIVMMAVKKGYRRNAVNTFLVDHLRKSTNTKTISFWEPTEEGEAFEKAYRKS